MSADLKAGPTSPYERGREAKRMVLDRRCPPGLDDAEQDAWYAGWDDMLQEQNDATAAARYIPQREWWEGRTEFDIAWLCRGRR